jgi:hypothetical protein
MRRTSTHAAYRLVSQPERLLLLQSLRPIEEICVLLKSRHTGIAASVPARLKQAEAEVDLKNQSKSACKVHAGF